MKIRFISKCFVLLLTLSLIGCSSDSDSDDGNNNPNNSITSITISRVGGGELFPGDTVIFTVETNTDQTITSQSTISVNGSAISGNSYLTTTSGQLSVSATYDNLTSNTLQVTVNEPAPITSITLSRVGNGPIYPGDNISFEVIGDTDEDVTSESTISVDGTPISGNNYEATMEGDLVFSAEYNGITSNSLTLTVSPEPTKFKKNVLIEDYTGTWCPFCPRVSYAMELVTQQTNDAVIVAIHRGSTNPSSGSYDPYNFPASDLENMINLQGYPTAMLDRTTDWNFPEPNNVAQVVSLTGNDADIGLAMTPMLNGNSVSVDLKVKFGTLLNNSNLKVVLYLLEDGLIFNQANNTSYYGGVNPIINFEHNHVLRATYTNILGDNIPTSQIIADQEYTTTITGTLPSGIADNSNLSLVAVVVNGGNNAALNTRRAYFGDDQNFEEQ